MNCSRWQFLLSNDVHYDPSVNIFVPSSTTKVYIRKSQKNTLRQEKFTMKLNVTSA